LAKALSRRGGCAGGPVGFAIDPRGGYGGTARGRPQPSTAAAAIEIDLAGKYRVRVGVGVEAEALRRVLDVLERR
jgi:hypothetical protein